MIVIRQHIVLGLSKKVGVTHLVWKLAVIGLLMYLFQLAEGEPTGQARHLLLVALNFIISRHYLC